MRQSWLHRQCGLTDSSLDASSLFLPFSGEKHHKVRYANRGEAQANPLNTRWNIQLGVCGGSDDCREGHEYTYSQREPNQTRQQQRSLHVPRTAFLLQLEWRQTGALFNGGKALAMDQGSPP